jgi:hypothetical protein
MSEAAMHVGSGVQQIIEGKAAEDRKEQHPPGDVPQPPQRGDVGGVEQVLRGKIPGLPG